LDRWWFHQRRSSSSDVALGSKLVMASLFGGRTVSWRLVVPARLRLGPIGPHLDLDGPGMHVPGLLPVGRGGGWSGDQLGNSVCHAISRQRLHEYGFGWYVLSRANCVWCAPYRHVQTGTAIGSGSSLVLLSPAGTTRKRPIGGICTAGAPTKSCAGGNWCRPTQVSPHRRSKDYCRRTCHKNTPGIIPGLGSADPGQTKELLPAHHAWARQR
jgi:hypothetical protein